MEFTKMHSRNNIQDEYKDYQIMKIKKDWHHRAWDAAEMRTYVILAGN
jgi:hypothetical protein